MRTILSIVIMISALTAAAHGAFEKVGELEKTKAKVIKLSSSLFALQPLDDDSKRYIAPNLPKEYKQAGLIVVIKGDIGKMPKDSRVAGIPLQLNCLKAKKAKSFGIENSSMDESELPRVKSLHFH